MKLTWHIHWWSETLYEGSEDGYLIGRYRCRCGVVKTIRYMRLP